MAPVWTPRFEIPPGRRAGLACLLRRGCDVLRVRVDTLPKAVHEEIDQQLKALVVVDITEVAGDGIEVGELLVR
jgi:hypothetical protein